MNEKKLVFKQIPLSVVSVRLRSEAPLGLAGEKPIIESILGESGFQLAEFENDAEAMLSAHNQRFGLYFSATEQDIVLSWYAGDAEYPEFEGMKSYLGKLAACFASPKIVLAGLRYQNMFEVDTEDYPIEDIFATDVTGRLMRDRRTYNLNLAWRCPDGVDYRLQMNRLHASKDESGDGTLRVDIPGPYNLIQIITTGGLFVGDNMTGYEALEKIHETMTSEFRKVINEKKLREWEGEVNGSATDI